MPRPKSRTSDEIAAAAVALLERDGHAALSMRSLARELGMSVMALYRYVSDRDDLERLVAEYVLSSLSSSVGEGHWTAQVVELVEQVRSAAQAHPEAIPLLLRHRHDSRSSIRWIERMLGVLAEAGFEGTGRVVAQRAIVDYLVGAIQSQHLSALSGPGTAVMAQLRDEEFPYLSQTAGIARGVSPDEEFRRGLMSVLAGLVSEWRPSADGHLIAISGLPGVGKTSVAAALVARTGAVHLSIDVVEEAILACGLPSGWQAGVAAYEAARAMAELNLRTGRRVVLDAVNDSEPARQTWRTAASVTGAALDFVHLVIADPREHERRLGGRDRGLAFVGEPTWADVQRRRAEFAAWTDDTVELDTSVRAADEVAAALAAQLGW